MIVLMDANALMIPAQFRVDIFEELRSLIGAYEPFILTEVVDELKGLARGQGRDGTAARHALILAERCTTVESGEETGGTVDDHIVVFARRHRCMVLTNDRGLRNRLLADKIPVISLKGQKKLDIIRK